MEAIKAVVVRLLNRAVGGYIKRNNIRVIAVAGSVGKTSAVNAIRTVLSQQYRVHMPSTAYNTNKSVHVELFDLPFATSTLGWVGSVGRVLVKSLGKAPYEIAVIEIGTDHPGELASFAWLQPQISVLTAIAPEHMEYFKTIEAVAEEELAVAAFSKHLVINANAVERKLVPQSIAEAAIWYGDQTDYRASNYRVKDQTVTANFTVAGHVSREVELQVLGEHSLDALVAASVVAEQSGMDQQQISAGLAAVTAVKGRMQRLEGRQDMLIIDDSYNASPQACKAALDVLVQFKASQRIAVLGSMNEMGDYSEQAHREVGSYCDPSRISMVVTIGRDARRYLAPAAKAAGCSVVSFDSPYAAGKYLLETCQPRAAVLFKGSQNGVFAEEAIKPLLATAADQERLVRQSAYWMQKKRNQFADA